MSRAKKPVVTIRRNASADEKLRVLEERWEAAGQRLPGSSPLSSDAMLLDETELASISDDDQPDLATSDHELVATPAGQAGTPLNLPATSVVRDIGSAPVVLEAESAKPTPAETPRRQSGRGLASAAIDVLPKSSPRERGAWTKAAPYVRKDGIATRSIPAYMPIELAQRLRAYAFKTDRKQSDIINEAVEAFLERYEERS